MSHNPDSQVVVLLERVRLSYFYGFEPYVSKNDQGKETRTFAVHGIFDANHPALEIVKAAQRKVAAAGWPSNAEAVLNQLAAQDKLCLHNGNISKMGNEDYKDKFFVSANSSKKPRIVVTRGGVNVEIDKNDPYAPYSGCWGNILVAIYAQGPDGKPSKYGKRINAQLMGVQFLEHDEAFGGGGRIAKPEEFPTVATRDADAAVPTGASGAANGLV